MKTNSLLTNSGIPPDIGEAEIFVETQFSIDSGQNSGTWFRLSDYSTIGEFFIDCAAWFDNEPEPEYAYLEWSNIPNGMIDWNRLSPNFFILRDALESIDDLQLGAFWHWCRAYGWDVAHDDPHKIVAEFCYSKSTQPGEDDDQPATDDDEYLFLVDRTGHSYEMFTENYN